LHACTNHIIKVVSSHPTSNASIYISKLQSYGIFLWELQDEIAEYVKNNMWNPEYPTLVYKKE